MSINDISLVFSKHVSQQLTFFMLVAFISTKLLRDLGSHMYIVLRNLSLFTNRIMYFILNH